MSKPMTAAVLSLLCACATETATRAYAPPTTDPAAYARVVIRNVSASALYASLWDDALTCSAPKVSLPGNGPFAAGQPVTIQAKKGDPLTIFATYFYAPGSSQQAPCHAITTFVPSAASYVVTYDRDASDRTVCSASWAEGDETSARPVAKERVANREFKLAFGQNGPWCRALTDAQRAGLGIAASPAGAPAAPARTGP